MYRMYSFCTFNSAKTLSLHFKFADSSCLGREDRTHLEELAFVRFVRTGITFLFNLRQGFIGSSIQLEFEDVDVVGSFYNTIYPSFTLLLFGIDGIATHHPHEQIESIVEVAFALTLGFLSTHGVWDVCQEGSEELAELFKIARFEGIDHILCPVVDIFASLQIIIGQYGDEPILHFIVREVQQIGVSTKIVILDRHLQEAIQSRTAKIGLQGQEARSIQASRRCCTQSDTPSIRRCILQFSQQPAITR